MSGGSKDIFQYIESIVLQAKNSFQLIDENNSIDCDGNLLSIEMLKAYAILIVILCHVSAPVLYHLNDTASSSSWWIANLYFSFSRHAVPLFVMASGMLLLDQNKTKKLSTFFHRRFLKVVIPLFFWGPLYLLWRFFFKNEALTISDSLKILIQGPIYYHLWFIYLILGLYLAAPILTSYLKGANKNNIIYFLCLWFFVVSIKPGLTLLLGANIGIKIFITTGFVGYFVLGKVLSPYLLKKQNRKYAYIIVILMTLTTAIGTFVLTARDGGVFNNFFTRSTSPTIIVMSVTIFLLINSFDYKLLYQKYLSLINFIQLQSRLSFGIYFLHFIFLDILTADKFAFKLSPLNYHSFWSIPLLVLVTYVLSSIFIYLMQRMPLIRKVVP